MRAHLLAEQTGLGSNAGAVLVGSGGDGLGEATRGPRASRSNGGGGGGGGVGSTGVGRGFAFGPGSGVGSAPAPAPFPLVDGKPKSARSGVAADPDFRCSMWRFVAGEAFRASGGRDSPAPSPADFRRRRSPRRARRQRAMLRHQILLRGRRAQERQVRMLDKHRAGKREARRRVEMRGPGRVRRARRPRRRRRSRERRRGDGGDGGATATATATEAVDD